MLDIVLRYHPIVKDIKQSEFKRILEVGSDDYGIAPFLNKGFKVTLFDTSFRRKSLKTVHYKTGSVLKLPFKKSAYDVVVSLDMLEHIPQKHRDKAINELLRVTKNKLYLGFPCDGGAKKRDLLFLKLVSPFKNLPHTKYIREHIENGLPRSKNVLNTIKSKSHYKVRLINNLNAKLELYLVVVSNLDFLPILAIQKLLDRLKWDILPSMFSIFMFLFGWMSQPFSYGKTYRKIFIVEKINSSK